MRLARALRPALRALAAHRLRAGLALCGVAIGVAAVLLTGALGAGAEREVGRSLEAMGTNLLVVRPAPAKRLVVRKEVRGFVTTLTPADAAALAELDAVDEAMPGMEGTLRVKGGGGSVTATVLGATRAFPRVRRFRLGAGRFFDAEEEAGARRVAVLGARVAERLFGDEPAASLIGRGLRLRGIPFEIVGVLEAKGVLADGSDEDNTIVIPIRTALRRVFNVAYLSTVFVIVRDSRDVRDSNQRGRMDAAQAEIGALLRQRHRLRGDAPADDFAVQDKAKLLASQRETVGTLTLFIAGISALALLVGGTGILALMLLSVKERTGEIGLRLAVGARPRDVLVQFLAEATALALGGWLAGVALAALGTVGLALGTSWKVAVPAGALLASLTMALLTGLGFGAVPARRASRLPPIRALGTE
ncbi:MAG: putative transport system permease protein [Acidobacteriota bacterium]|jgi:putative ABC transport system permease protein|nr:putative transport system permease protein [Acidobacteriota bacterium]